MPKFTDRVAAEAADVRPVRALLTVLAGVFYVLGLIIGAAIVAVSWSIGAVKVGIGEVRSRANGPVRPANDVAEAD